MADDLSGHVYVLTSPNTEFIKIGGTNFPPMKRLREINGYDPYRALGPWHLVDFRQVSDWRKVEAHLHYAFRSSLVTEITGQRELFSLKSHVVSASLASLDPEFVIKRPVVDRMFQDAEFSAFVIRIFAFTGLLNWLDIQGAWTFVLFPATGGGRYFTINIGRHEVAFSTLPRRETGLPIHSIVLDRLIYDFSDVIDWLNAHDGGCQDDVYASALARSVSVYFSASFDDAARFLQLVGVRRALIAYWAEALTGLRERGALSFFARYHNWNAVAEINMRSNTSLPTFPAR